MAYTIEKKIFSDVLSDTYDVVDEYSNMHYNMTEFFSDGMTSQNNPDIAAQKYLSLYRSLWTLKNISLTSLPKLINVEEDASIVIIWESLYGLSLKDYMETYNARISYKALLNILSPLLDDCETAHQNGLYFTVSPETVFITDGGVLKLNTLVNPTGNIYTANMGVAHTIFFMLTGFPYGNVQIPIGVYIPNPLWQLLYDILTWHREFESIGEFHNAIRIAIRSSENEGISTKQKFFGKSGKKQNKSPGAIAAGVGIGCFSLLTLLLVLVVIGLIRRPSPVNSQNWAVTPSTGTQAEDTGGNFPFQSVSFENVYFNPDNENEIFDGMILQTDNGLFYRQKSGGTAQLVREDGSGQTVILSNVFPSFMQSDGQTVYFCDGYKGYNIFSYDGKILKPLLNKAAGYLCLFENYLYYIDDEDNGSIYRLDTRTNEAVKINDDASYDLTVVGASLYYIDIIDNNAIYYIDLDSGNPDAKPLRLRDNEQVYGYELKNLKGNLLYCSYIDWQLYIITGDQSEAPLIYPVSEYSYDIYGDTLYYLDDENCILHELLIAEGGKDTVISTVPAVYIAAVNGGVFYVSEPNDYALCRIRNNKNEIVDIIQP